MNQTTQIGIAFICGFLTYVAMVRWKQRRYLGPKYWPLIGAGPELIQNYHRMHDWLLSYFEKHSTVSSMMPGGKMYYYTVEPENVRYILKTNFKNFPKGEVYYERMEVLLGDGIFNTDGEKWKHQRKTASAEFSTRSLRDFNALVFKDEALKLSHLLLEIEGQRLSIDLQDLFMRMTLDSIMKIGFGVDICTLPRQLPLRDNTFAKGFDLANEIVTSRFIDPLWKLKRFFNFGSEFRLDQSIKMVDSFTYGVINKRKAEIAIAKSQPGPPEETKLDIITRFLELSQDEDSPIGDKTLRDIVLNFVIAGRDTTAVTLSWFVYSLTENPVVAHRLYKELRSFESRKRGSESGFGTQEDSPQHFAEEVLEFSELLTYETLKAEELPYLQAAISETLRLFPAVPLDPKGIQEDDVLPDGTRLRKGGLISYSPYCMARMSYIWGEDAKDFNPDRWLHDGKYQPECEFKFATFQAGLRTCLGKDSAYLQLKMTGAILCRFFEFHRVQGHQVRYRMMAILSMASGLKVNVRRRYE